MAESRRIVCMTELRWNAANVVDRAKGSKKPLIITQRGRAAAVMSGVERYDPQEREQEIAERNGHGLREVMEDADRMLSRK